MLEKYEMPDGLWNFISKILIPAIVGVGFKLGIEMKKTNTKVSFFNLLLSFIIGLCAVMIFQYPVEALVTEKAQLPVSGIIAMSSQRIGEFIVYKWHIDTFITGLLNYIIGAFTTNKDKQE